MTRRSAHVLTFLIPVAALALLADHGTLAQGCGSNPIVCENMLAGAPASEWDVPVAGDATIQGFATAISVNRGETVRFKIKTTATSYRLDIYRMGYYNGMGARKVATVNPSVGTAADAARLSHDAGDRAGRLRQLGGIGLLGGAGDRDVRHLLREARRARTPGGASHIIFVVRDDSGAFRVAVPDVRHDLAGLQHLRRQQPLRRARRPDGPTRSATTGRSSAADDDRRSAGERGSSTPNTRWCGGSKPTATTSATRAAWTPIGAAPSSWSTESFCRSATTNTGRRSSAPTSKRRATPASTSRSSARNEVFWKTRWENDAAGNAYRTLVCYKETLANAKIDPTAAWTGTWRDPRFSPPADGGRPGERADRHDLHGERHAQRRDRGPGGRGQAALLAQHRDRDRSPPARRRRCRPGRSATSGTRTSTTARGRPGLMRLSSTTVDVHVAGTCWTTDPSYGAGTATHSLTLYRHSSGALVFGAGTVQWAWGLDADARSRRDRRPISACSRRR